MRTRSLYWLCLVLFSTTGHALDYVENDYFSQQVESRELPPVEQRVPKEPAIVAFDREFKTGQHGGTLRLLMGKTKDIRMMMVYGYGRLIGYNQELQLKADIVKHFTVEAGRIFTFYLREGHRWSDGHPFTSEAFRYYWEDVLNNEELYPFGLPSQLLVDGQPPEVEFIDAITVRYFWDQPNPFFLPALAGPRPLFLYAPAHYLKQFHGKYADPIELAKKIKKAGKRNWAGLHHRKNHPYKNDNPELPVLQPWVNSTKPPAKRFVFKANPFYHRVDSERRQLPYINEVVVQITSPSLVAAKTGSGESDLQGRYIRLDNYTFLKQGEERGNYQVRLWQNGSGSQYAIYPNLNSNNPTWRALVRQRSFRHALSIGINRH